MTATVQDFVRLAGATASVVVEGTLQLATLPNGSRLCVGRFAGALFAVKDDCPHAEFPLSEGSLLPNGELECCWHGARFDCRSGAVRRGPAEDALVMYEIEARDDALFARRAPRSGS